MAVAWAAESRTLGSGLTALACDGCQVTWYEMHVVLSLMARIGMV